MHVMVQASCGCKPVRKCHMETNDAMFSFNCRVSNRHFVPGILTKSVLFSLPENKHQEEFLL